MGYLATIINEISNDVVAALAAASYPPLTDGAIVVGTAAEFEQGDAPRIIFDPTPGSKLHSPEYYSAEQDFLGERRVQNALRTIAGEDVMFAVHCWGAADTGVVVDDYDVTRGLYHAVRAVLQKRLPGEHAIDETGKYRTGTNLRRRGRWYTFGVTIFTPVLSGLLPYDRVKAYAPDGVVPVGTDLVVLPTGETEAGCS